MDYNPAVAATKWQDGKLTTEEFITYLEKPFNNKGYVNLHRQQAGFYAVRLVRALWDNAKE